MKQTSWYRAHFVTGVLEFQARNLAEASKLASELGAEHYPRERMIGVSPVSVRTRVGGARKKVKK